MATRQLTAPEALREVARRLAEARPGSKLPYLCNRTRDLKDEGRISEATLARIEGRITLHLGPLRTAYGSDPKTDQVEPRILAALWMAHELEEEDRLEGTARRLVRLIRAS